MITRSNQATIVQFMKRTPERVESGDFPRSWTDEMIEYCYHIIVWRTMHKDKLAKIRQEKENELKAREQRKEKAKLLATVVNWIKEHTEEAQKGTHPEDWTEEMVSFFTQLTEDEKEYLTPEERKLHQRLSNKRYYETHKEEINRRNKEYRERNKDYCKAYDKLKHKRVYQPFNITRGCAGITVRCVETGEIFDSAAEASRSMGLDDNAVARSIHEGYRSGGYYWEYVDVQVESHKFNQKDYQKKYNGQICEYKGETLTLKALLRRFQRAGVEHPAIEAKKYLKNS